jgi:hypothetical protein
MSRSSRIVAIAHFVSHVYTALPPIFLLVKDHFGVGYTEIAPRSPPTMSSALLQTPAGFMVDRIGHASCSRAA